MHTNGTSPITNKTLNDDALDSVERLALGIIGKLALNDQLKRSSLTNDGGGGLYSLFESITEALREGLPLVDGVEFQRARQSN